MTELILREMSVIKKELDDLNALIGENIELIHLYPYDSALKFNLESLKCQHELILDELFEARSKKGKDTYDLVFEGDAVRGTSISMHLIGILGTYQDIVTSMVQRDMCGERSSGRISYDVKKMSELLVVATAPGSFRVIIGGSENCLDEPRYRKAMNEINDLIDCGYDKNKIKEKRKVVGARVFTKYKRLLLTLKDNGSSMGLYEKYRGPGIVPHRIHKEDAEKIYAAINEVEQKPDEIMEYEGYLVGCMLDTRTVHFKTMSDEIISAKMDDDLTGIETAPCLDSKMDQTVKSRAEFTLSREYNEAEDKESKNWTLIKIRPI